MTLGEAVNQNPHLLETEIREGVRGDFFLEDFGHVYACRLTSTEVPDLHHTLRFRETEDVIAVTRFIAQVVTDIRRAAQQRRQGVPQVANINDYLTANNAWYLTGGSPVFTTTPNPPTPAQAREWERAQVQVNPLTEQQLPAVAPPYLHPHQHTVGLTRDEIDRVHERLINDAYQRQRAAMQERVFADWTTDFVATDPTQNATIEAVTTTNSSPYYMWTEDGAMPFPPIKQLTFSDTLLVKFGRKE